jgi:chorismate-pyruvate lyase
MSGAGLILLSALSVDAFRTELLAANSATAVLQAHCPTAMIKAERSKRTQKPAPDTVRARLLLTGGDTIRHRRVRLKCGGRTYSAADNWYVPERLTPEMNRQLNSSDTPYGRAIAPLKATRQTLTVSEPNGRHFLVVTAVLTSGGGAPLSVVVESYRRTILRAP